MSNATVTLSSNNVSHYMYNPSKAAAIVFAVLYLVEVIVMAWQLFRKRAWVWTVMFVAVIMETMGYFCRIASIKNVEKRGIYIAQFCLIVLAPVLIAAAYYVVFGRIISHTLPKELRKIKLLWVPPRFVTVIFVGCDIIAFLLQAWGAILVSSAQLGDKKKIKKGKNIVLGGLGVQIACFGYFCFCAIRANFKLGQYNPLLAQNPKIQSNGPTFKVVGKSNRTYKTRWNALMVAVNIGSLLVLARSIYRVCEFSLGKTGYIEEHEWTFYVFDAIPMLICFILFNIFHPGDYLPNLGFRGSKQDIWAGDVQWTQMQQVEETR